VLGVRDDLGEDLLEGVVDRCKHLSSESLSMHRHRPHPTQADVEVCLTESTEKQGTGTWVRGTLHMAAQYSASIRLSMKCNAGSILGVHQIEHETQRWLYTSFC